MSSIPPLATSGPGSALGSDAQSSLTAGTQRKRYSRVNVPQRKCPCFFLLPNKEAHILDGQRRFCEDLVKRGKAGDILWEKRYIVILPNISLEREVIIRADTLESGNANFSSKGMLMRVCVNPKKGSAGLSEELLRKLKDSRILLFPKDETGEASRKKFLQDQETQLDLSIAPDQSAFPNSVTIRYNGSSSGSFWAWPNYPESDLSISTSRSAFSQSRPEYYHGEFQKLVKEARFEAAEEYLNKHSPKWEDLFETTVYSLDQSYCLRRKKEFQKAAELLSKVIETVTLKISEISCDVKAMPWHVLKYLALVNRAKCNIKLTFFDKAEEDLDKIEEVKPSLPQGVAARETRVREARIELSLAKGAQDSSLKDDQRTAYELAAKEAQKLVEAYEGNPTDKKEGGAYLLGRAYETQGDILLRLGEVEAKPESPLKQLDFFLSAYEKFEKAYAIYEKRKPQQQDSSFYRYLKRAGDKKDELVSHCLNWVKENPTVQLDKKRDQLIQSLRKSKSSKDSSNSTSSSSSSSSRASSG